MTNPTDKAMKQIEYNVHDMGELGHFIRIEYAKNIFTTYRDEVIEKIEKMDFEWKVPYLTVGDAIIDINPALEERDKRWRKQRDQLIKELKE